MKVKISQLAKALGITVNAVRAAMNDGRITTYKKKGKAYEFDLELAVQEYELNTNQNLSSNPRFQDEENEDESDEENAEGKKEKVSVLDKDPKWWNANEATQARMIYSALKVKHELGVQEGKFYTKKEADQEFTRMATTFARGLILLPNKLKQKIPELTDSNVKMIKELCAELIAECEQKL